MNFYGTDEYWFTPHDGSTDAQAVGKKPFVVAGGKINIQAVPKECESWTHLIEKVTDHSLKVSNDFAHCLKWNDQLLVTSSTKEWNAESIRRITSISPSEDGTDSSIITIDDAITRSLPGLLSPEPEFAVEVASLSRNVHFTAESDDPEGNHVGGHFMVGWTSSVEQIITGVKISNFGQGGNLGRYPIHFHFSGISPSTISKNVIVNSNQRCILIHATNGVTVDSNICYNHKGHGIATETGREENNVFKYNLICLDAADRCFCIGRGLRRRPSTVYNLDHAVPNGSVFSAAFGF